MIKKLILIPYWLPVVFYVSVLFFLDGVCDILLNP